MERLTETGVGPEFLLSEANGNRSREQISVGASQTLAAGAVLGQVTVGGAYVAHDSEAEDGSEDVAGILYDAVTTGAGEAADAVAVVRDAEVIADRLTGLPAPGAARTAVITALAALGVIVR